MDKIRPLLTRLAKYYWSPLPPHRYVLPTPEGRVQGLGLVAYRSFGAFNLAWRYCAGNLSSLERHQAGMRYFIAIYPHMTTTLNGANLDTWLTLLTEREFEVWWKAIHRQIPGPVVKLVESALAMDTHE